LEIWNKSGFCVYILRQNTPTAIFYVLYFVAQNVEDVTNMTTKINRRSGGKKRESK
jgi:hypothetical protein